MAHYSEADIWNWMAEVSDPEIPVLNVVELGIVRQVTIHSDRIQIIITLIYNIIII